MQKKEQKGKTDDIYKYFLKPGLLDHKINKI